MERIETKKTYDDCLLIEKKINLIWAVLLSQNFGHHLFYLFEIFPAHNTRTCVTVAKPTSLTADYYLCIRRGPNMKKFGESIRPSDAPDGLFLTH